jgi:DNA polymerase (family 10)
VLDEVADLLEIQGANAFRVRAYRTAARSIQALGEPVTAIVARNPHELEELPGIGADLAGKIAEIVRTGDLGLRRELAREVPPGVVEMMRIQDVGPKRAKLFWDKLGVQSVAALAEAARSGKLLGVRGVGEILQKRILEGCGRQQAAPAERRLLAEALAAARALLAWLEADPAVERVDVAGSIRRRKETIGDVDILAASSTPRAVAERFVAYPGVARVVAQGETRCAVALSSGLQVDLRIVSPSTYGAALAYFTGSKAHNIAIRTMALEEGLKVSEYGVFRDDRRIGGAEERDVYDAVGLPFIVPELREDCGEIEAARAGHLPRLVELEDIRGDLHVHTDASDGRDTLEAMVDAAVARGYAYVAVTDHTQALRVAHGLDRAALVAQGREIDALRSDKGICILKGAEVDILADGALDLDDETLDALDIVVAAVHSRLDMEEGPMTERVLRALRHPRVAVLAHPTGRRLTSRPPCKLDLLRVVRAARELGVLLEINAQPQRLDLCDVLVRMARDEGARFVIDTDAHRKSELDWMQYGVDQARRGWCSAKDVANTRPFAELVKLCPRIRAVSRVPSVPCVSRHAPGPQRPGGTLRRSRSARARDRALPPERRRPRRGSSER